MSNDKGLGDALDQRREAQTLAIRQEEQARVVAADALHGGEEKHFSGRGFGCPDADALVRPHAGDAISHAIICQHARAVRPARIMRSFPIHWSASGAVRKAHSNGPVVRTEIRPPAICRATRPGPPVVICQRNLPVRRPVLRRQPLAWIGSTSTPSQPIRVFIVAAATASGFTLSSQRNPGRKPAIASRLTLADWFCAVRSDWAARTPATWWRKLWLAQHQRRLRSL